MSSPYWRTDANLNASLGRTDVRVMRPIDVQNAIFRHYIITTLDGDVQPNVQNVEPNNMYHLMAKTYNDLDNEYLFKELRILHHLREQSVANEDVDNRIIPQLLRVVPTNPQTNRPPLICTRINRNIPLICLAEHNHGFSAEFVLMLLLRGLESLRMLHSMDYVHCNIKMEDIMLFPEEDGPDMVVNHQNVQAYANHPILHNAADFTVGFENLEQAKPYRVKKHHRCVNSNP